jgi:nucleoside-diphosphate-sugar epimerase
MSKIVVTGASGFIGRRLAARVQGCRPGSDLRCLVKDREDPFGLGGADFLLSRSMRPLPTDLVFPGGFGELPKPDILFHLAANTHTWENDHRCNDIGTENLLSALGPQGPANHVVFTSTTAVMDNRNSLDEPLGPLAEVEHPPFSRYGQSKWRAEKFLRAESARQGFPLSIVRLCTVYGPEPRPNTLFDVLKREVAAQTLVSRLDWPGLTSFIHVDDVVSCLMKIGDNPPSTGETRTYLLATESKTLAEVSRLLYWVQGLAYRMISLPTVAWNVLSNAHRLCRWGAGSLPARIYNTLWRFNMVVNPVFHCDTRLMGKWFPELRPRLMADCVHEI